MLPEKIDVFVLRGLDVVQYSQYVGDYSYSKEERCFHKLFAYWFQPNGGYFVVGTFALVSGHTMGGDCFGRGK